MQVISCYSQECLKLVAPNEGEYTNVNYHKIDSCVSSETYNKLFVQRGILIRMSEYIFSQVPISLDTIVTINAIDTTYDSVITAFANIQTKFENFSFRRYRLLSGDSEFFANPILILDFEDYCQYDSLRQYLYNVPLINLVQISNPPNRLYYVPTDKAMKQNEDMGNILWDQPTGGGL